MGAVLFGVLYTLSGSSIFVTSNAEIWAHQEGEGEEAKDYTMFVFDNDGFCRVGNINK